MNVAGALLIVALVAAGLVVWFLFALWVGSLLGRAIHAGQHPEYRLVDEDDEREEEAHEPQRRRLDFPRGAP